MCCVCALLCEQCQHIQPGLCAAQHLYGLNDNIQWQLAIAAATATSTTRALIARAHTHSVSGSKCALITCSSVCTMYVHAHFSYRFFLLPLCSDHIMSYLLLAPVRIVFVLESKSRMYVHSAAGEAMPMRSALEKIDLTRLTECMLCYL